MGRAYQIRDDAICHAPATRGERRNNYKEGAQAATARERSRCSRHRPTRRARPSLNVSVPRLSSFAAAGRYTTCHLAPGGGSPRRAPIRCQGPRKRRGFRPITRRGGPASTLYSSAHDVLSRFCASRSGMPAITRTSPEMPLCRIALPPTAPEVTGRHLTWVRDRTLRRDLRFTCGRIPAVVAWRPGGRPRRSPSLRMYNPRPRS